MRSLIDAALEAQAQRVIDAKPRDLPKCGTSKLVFSNCRYCGIELAKRGCPNKTGVCGAYPCQSRKRQEFNSERKVWDAIKEAVEERKRRLLAAATADHSLSREVLSERFGFHVDAITKMMADEGLQCAEPWWFGMRKSTAPGPSYAWVTRPTIKATQTICISCGKPFSTGGRPNISGYCRSNACRYQYQLARNAKKKPWIESKVG